MIYKILIDKNAAKALTKIPKKDQEKIIGAITKLETNPYPHGCRKLVGSENNYRLRAGDYRIIYIVFDKRVEIVIIDIGHRKDIYK